MALRQMQDYRVIIVTFRSVNMVSSVAGSHRNSVFLLTFSMPSSRAYSSIVYISSDSAIETISNPFLAIRICRTPARSSVQTGLSSSSSSSSKFAILSACINRISNHSSVKLHGNVLSGPVSIISVLNRLIRSLLLIDISLSFITLCRVLAGLLVVRLNANLLYKYGL